MTLPSLLPHGASPVEHSLGETQARLSGIPVERLAALWNPDDCPEELLGVLAWSLGADPWDPDWPEAVRRQALRDAPRIHAERGTWAAIDRVLALAGAVAEIDEGPDSDAGLSAMQGRVRIFNSASLHRPLGSLAEDLGRAGRLAFELQVVAEEGISGTIPAGGAILPLGAGAMTIS